MDCVRLRHRSALHHWLTLLHTHHARRVEHLTRHVHHGLGLLMHHVRRWLSKDLRLHVIKGPGQEELHVLIMITHVGRLVCLAGESEFHHRLVRVRKRILRRKHERVELVDGVVDAERLSRVRVSLCACRRAAGRFRRASLHVNRHKVAKVGRESVVLEAWHIPARDGIYGALGECGRV